MRSTISLQTVHKYINPIETIEEFKKKEEVQMSTNE